VRAAPPKIFCRGSESVMVAKLTTKLTTLPNHCRTLPPSPCLIASKIIRGISSPFSLSTPYGGYIVAVLYHELDMGSWFKIYKDSFQNLIFRL